MAKTSRVANGERVRLSQSKYLAATFYLLLQLILEMRVKTDLKKNPREAWSSFRTEKTH